MPADRPLHLRRSSIVAVLVGGVLGTAARYSLSTAFPTASGHWPWATFGINVTGAFVLGALLETLARRGPDEGTRRIVRLAVGTGFLGAYTTYSSLATETDLLVRADAWATGLAYSLVSVVLGILAATAGIAASAGAHRARAVRRGAGIPLDPDADVAGEDRS